MESLKEMGRFLDSSKSWKLNQEEFNNLSTAITNEETEIVVCSFPTENNSVKSIEFYGTFQSDLPHNFLKILRQIEAERALPFCLQNQYHSKQKPCRDRIMTTTEEKKIAASLKNSDLNMLNKIHTHRIKKYTKKTVHHDQVSLNPGIQKWFNMTK